LTIMCRIAYNYTGHTRNTR